MSSVTIDKYQEIQDFIDVNELKTSPPPLFVAAVEHSQNISTRSRWYQSYALPEENFFER